ncbi:glucuronoxylan glucuronosyltransferase f8h-like, putative [Bodo saltans]|uniref:Glucuronoxylan glucuronosyltransferase f8h-like, putative n=1 Tax=Bodo saltans TaxID=75058 RepID=A0A0S4JSN4_BODSA|nr:glucuronoxylan glucuronosyltransferase f8h-like, putative [Bodo saltans]|eukprot:CUG92349.1 glucuronoxylan glucuronosyltransferase f8h-like, putative [Bodo saltans]
MKKARGLLEASSKVRAFAIPLLSLVIGILLGSSWTFVQLHVASSTSVPAATSHYCPLRQPEDRRAVSSAETTVVLPDLTFIDDKDADAKNFAADVGLAGPSDWEAAIAGAELPSLHHLGAGGVIPQGMLPRREGSNNGPTPPALYATSGEHLLAALDRRRAAAQQSSDVTRPFRFHIYDIPDRYTMGALQLLEQHWPNSFCNRHTVKTNYTMLDWRHAFSLFTVDILITKYLRYHPSHTANPSEADVFIIPMMTHLYHCAGVNHYNIEVLSWVTKHHHYKHFLQHDHFLFWWRWGMHYNSVLRFWKRVVRHFPNVNLISFDYLEIMGRNVYQDFSLALKPRFLQSMHSIIMPYPDYSPELSQEKLLTTPSNVIGVKRKIFFYFAGTSTIGGIRRWIKRNCDAANDPAKCYYEDFAKNVIDAARLGVPKGYPAAMRNSLFCGHAAGDALSSRRPTSAILANCIPVLICDLCLYAFENLIDYDTFAVFVSEDDVISGKLLERLESIPQARIEQMQRNLLAVRHHFVYNVTGPPRQGDALDTLVTQLSLRGSILRQYRRWFTTNHALSADAKDYPLEPPARKRYVMKGNAAEERDFNKLQ